MSDLFENVPLTYDPRFLEDHAGSIIKDPTTALVELVANAWDAYGNNSPVAIQRAALRIRDIVIRIGETEDIQESMALNTYVRAELVRLVAARIRLQAARTQPLSAAQLQQAAARMAEQDFMEFTLEDLD